MDKPARDNKRILIMGIACFVFVCLLVSGFFLFKMLLEDDQGRKKRQVQRITLVKPPPPEKIKEKPPEPEIKKEEKIVEPEPKEVPEEPDDSAKDEPPPGDDLGLDSDGTGGSDGFGLAAKKGGRSLIGGGGDSSLLARYAWYTRILQDEIRTKVNQFLEDKKDLPDGKHRILLRVELDAGGRMTSFAIDGSSGNPQVDDAVKEALAGFKVSEAPPEDMPKTVKLKVTFKS
jgi:TonB family protein